ncbi:hypothetical protein PPYR_15046 [Photinus pyralis]|uniref:OSK domain-containing protein n=2 Tax=Photinus pyralis TaxID=7054 RepID=A0A5N3ZZQ8_PHOPY|nr:uncharacterized protein LOC116181875 [Photinus pyralis]KAB0790550.1 hypothetical protein PPYR_15046 [Photinus pyralis]
MQEVHNPRRKKIFSQLAIGGQTISQLQKRVVRCRAAGYQYRLASEVFVMIGTNDVLRNTPYNSMKLSLLRLLATIKNQGVQNIRLCTILPIHRATGDQRDTLNKFNDFVRRVKDRRVVVVDVESFFSNPKYFERDGVHLNLDGLERLETIWFQQ